MEPEKRCAVPVCWQHYRGNFTSKTAWRSSLCLVSRCRRTPRTSLSEPQVIQYMTVTLLLGTERPILYSLACLSPCCNSQDRWAEAKTHARIYLGVKFVPQYNVLIYRFSFWEAQGCCCPIPIRRASSGIGMWGKHTPFIVWKGRMLPVCPVCISFAVHHFMFRWCLSS